MKEKLTKIVCSTSLRTLEPPHTQKNTTGTHIRKSKIQSKLSKMSEFEHPDADEAMLQGFESEASKTRHPIALIFHFAFKLAALLWYLFSGYIVELRSLYHTLDFNCWHRLHKKQQQSINNNNSGFVLTFIVQVLLLAADFWTGAFLLSQRYMRF